MKKKRRVLFQSEFIFNFTMAVEKNIKQKEKQNLYKIMKQQNKKEKKAKLNLS